MWGQAAQTHLNKILNLQKRVLRLIHFAPFRSHAIPLFHHCNILPINLLYFKAVSTMMHDVFNNLTPANISNLFTPSAKVYHYNTRSSTAGNLYVRHSRTEHLKNSFSRIGARIWNSIPQDCRLLSKNKFKKELHQNILYILFQEDTYVNITTLINLFKNRFKSYK